MNSTFFLFILKYVSEIPELEIDVVFSGHAILTVTVKSEIFFKFYEI